MAQSRSRFYSQELPLAFAEHLTDWVKSGTEGAVSILVTGKSGSGKSTLINALLRDQAAPTRNDLQGARITLLKSYKRKIGKVQVTAWESPGLQGFRDRDKDDIKTKCSNVDLVMFCVDMTITRYNEQDHLDTMKKLDGILGPEIWEKVVFVLTFADNYIMQVEDSIADPTQLKENFLKKIEVWRKRLQSTLELILDQHSEDKSHSEKPKVVIKVAPAGTSSTLKLLPEFPSWISMLWLEAMNVNIHATPALIHIYYEVSSDRSDTSTTSTQYSILKVEKDFLISAELDIPELKGKGL